MPAQGLDACDVFGLSGDGVTLPRGPCRHRGLIPATASWSRAGGRAGRVACRCGGLVPATQSPWITRYSGPAVAHAGAGAWYLQPSPATKPFVVDLAWRTPVRGPGTR